MTATFNPPATGTLEGELLTLLARQAQRVPLSVFLACAMIGAFAWGKVPPPAILGWLALVALVLAVRRRVLTRLPSQAHLNEAKRLRIATVLSAVNGITHGLSLAFFLDIPELERTLHTLVLLGLCAGAVGTTAGYRPLFVSYMLPTAGGLALAWAILPSLDGASWLEASMAILILLFCGVLLSLARDTWGAFSESFSIRLQQVALNRQLQQALEEAEAASRAKTRFLASASHDLRQPLHTLSLFGAALEMRPLDPRSHEIARNMNEALQDLASELDSLLDVSKLDAGVIRATPMTIDLGRLLARVAEPYRGSAAREGIALRMDCDPDLLVESDRGLLERVLRNLVDNAFKYTEAGEVRIEAHRQDPRIELSISDTGIGIPAAERTRVFEEFYQIGNRERDRRKGLGLGLSIVRRLVDLLGIGLRLESEPGLGTRFVLELKAAASTGAAPPETVARVSPLSSLRVLVIDDEPAVRLGMKTLLEGLGCDVSLASGTDEAVAVSARGAPDLILADLRLRDQDDGIIAVRAVRSRHPGTPALLVSGDTAPDRLREADAAGIPMLHKPVPADSLRQAIAQATGRDAVPVGTDRSPAGGADGPHRGGDRDGGCDRSGVRAPGKSR